MRLFSFLFFMFFCAIYKLQRLDYPVMDEEHGIGILNTHVCFK